MQLQTKTINDNCYSETRRRKSKTANDVKLDFWVSNITEIFQYDNSKNAALRFPLWERAGQCSRTLSVRFTDVHRIPSLYDYYGQPKYVCSVWSTVIRNIERNLGGTRFSRFWLLRICNHHRSPSASLSNWIITIRRYGRKEMKIKHRRGLTDLVKKIVFLTSCGIVTLRCCRLKASRVSSL